MTPAKLIFDENLPPSIVTDIEGLLRRAKPEETAQLKHVHQLYAELSLPSTQGNWDEVWVPAIENQGWTVVAGDRGKTPGKGKKLPSLCVKHNITHVLLSPAVHGRPKFKKLLTILSVWHELIEIAKGDRGVRYFIEPADALSISRGRLVRKDIPLSEPPPRGYLFRK